MFEERGGITRLIIICLSVVLIIFSICWMVVKINHYNEMKSQNRIDACALINNEEIRDNCINGAYYTYDDRR